jgi:hypothetical protein
MTKPDPISTSPLAMQAYQIIKHLDQLVGTIEAQLWMMRVNTDLDGITPVDAIKQRKTAELVAAVRIVAIEKGLFAEPFLPPHAAR